MIQVGSFWRYHQVLAEPLGRIDNLCYPSREATAMVTVTILDNRIDFREPTVWTYSVEQIHGYLTGLRVISILSGRSPSTLSLRM